MAQERTVTLPSGTKLIFGGIHAVCIQFPKQEASIVLVSSREDARLLAMTFWSEIDPMGTERRR